jgi:hypothetical protein
MKLRRLSAFGILLLITWVPIIVLAQDYTSGLRDEKTWTSPIVETTKDTRIEWEVHLTSASVPEYTFIIRVVRESGEIWDTKAGGTRNGDIVKAQGSIDFAMRCYLEVTTNAVRVWIVKLFLLAFIPETTTPTTTTTTSTPTTTTTAPPQTTIPQTVTVAETTYTNTVTVVNRDPVTETITVAETTYTRLVAAFTDYPEGTRLVTPVLMSWLTGFLIAVLAGILFSTYQFRKKGGIIIYSETDEKEPEENVGPGRERTEGTPDAVEEATSSESDTGMS